MSLKTTVWSFALRVYAVWYPVNMAMRYLVPSLFVFPFTDMELSTVCTEMGKVNARNLWGFSQHPTERLWPLRLNAEKEQ